MPGLNQKGPMNEGSMTGRGFGRCATSNQDVSGNTDTTWNGQGNGRGQGRAMGRGRCQRIWSNQDTAGKTQTPQQLQPAEDEALKLRIYQLETELEAIKNQMENQ